MTLATLVAAQSLYSIAVFLSEVPTGIFADIYGQKKSIIVGYLIEVFSVAMLLIQPNAITFLILYFIRGVGSSFVSGSEEALIYESAQRTEHKDYKRIYSRFLSNSQLGFVFATITAGVVFSYFGSASFVPLIIASTTCFLIVAFAAMFLDDYKNIKVSNEKGKDMFDVVRKSFRLSKSNYIVKSVILVSALTLSGEYFIQDVYQPYFQSYGVEAFWLGAVLSFGTLLNAFFLRKISIFENIFSTSKLILAINLFLGVCYVLLTILVSPVFLVGLYVIMNGLFNIQQPILSDYVNRETESDIRATVLSTISLIRRFVQMFIFFLIAFLLSNYGIEKSFIFQGAYLVAGGLASYFILENLVISSKSKKIYPDRLASK